MIKSWINGRNRSFTLSSKIPNEKETLTLWNPERMVERQKKSLSIEYRCYSIWKYFTLRLLILYCQLSDSYINILIFILLKTFTPLSVNTKCGRVSVSIQKFRVYLFIYSAAMVGSYKLFSVIRAEWEWGVLLLLEENYKFHFIIKSIYNNLIQILLWLWQKEIRGFWIIQYVRPMPIPPFPISISHNIVWHSSNQSLEYDFD